MDQAPDLIVRAERNAVIITFNRPKKKNAVPARHYNLIIDTLAQAAVDKNIALVVITGNGDYFTSGNDFSLEGLQGIDQASSSDGTHSPSGFQRFIQALIDFPKPLIAVVNGPAVGVGVTMLGLCDVVYASDRATFHTPFVTLGLVPEGCSSYLFPRIMGYGKAAEMLMFGHKMTALEAYHYGLVTQVFPDECLKDVWPRIFAWAQYSPKVLSSIKKLMRSHQMQILQEINIKENACLQERMMDPEVYQNIVNMLSRKSKL